MLQGQVLLKAGTRGVWHFLYLFFSRFVIFIFRDFTVLLFYSLQNCVIHLKIEGKLFFFYYHNFMKKSHSKLCKNEPLCMCKEGWCVRLGQEGAKVVCVRVRELSELHYKGVEKKREERKQILKIEASWVKGWMP